MHLSAILFSNYKKRSSDQFWLCHLHESFPFTLNPFEAWRTDLIEIVWRSGFLTSTPVTLTHGYQVVPYLGGSNSL